MDIYYIIQLDTNKYILLNEDFKRLDKTGKELPHVLDGKKATLKLGELIFFIKKQNKATYTSFIKFSIPQILNIINEHDILSKKNINKITTDKEQ